ncbi:hypothetical protein [Aquimarina sp. 2201CG5-10]|uniref:hypothetical protein n=1 Tax=Aquimarina callyspongiae TaxID=3098150 RepID=UPI002AB3C7B1|nr:hypothetical protein [Aquimarina sp. 2201CG5-10]MDY8137309.1 hypothetical protein [Aquimarina sp. 2201CG5-10]
MRIFYLALITVFLSSSCNTKTKKIDSEQEPLPIIGTWKLISGTVINGKDTTITDYTKNQKMIKIINQSHFAFLRHDLNNGKDSTAIFVSGGGKYSVDGNKYTEYLEYCNYREWENNTFEFEYRISGDTLITVGIEKVEKIGVDHLNIEKLIRVKE